MRPYHHLLSCNIEQQSSIINRCFIYLRKIPNLRIVYIIFSCKNRMFNQFLRLYKFRFISLCFNRAVPCLMLFYYIPAVKYGHTTTKAGPKPCLNINVCYLPLDIYVDSRLEGDRELIVKNLDALYVVPYHLFIVLGKFCTLLLQQISKFLDARLVSFRLCLLH